jgi:hypothetical protein
MANKKLDLTGNIFEIGVKDNTDKESASTVASAVASSASTIRIKKKKFKESRTNVGWRINSSTVDTIKELAFESRMGINEFVQELLDKALGEIKIE